MGKREEKSQETRRLLLAAAEERIRMSGYEQVSVAEITRAAGVAKGTFYNYFEKKEDLIRALYHSHFEELNAGITALAEGDACAGIRAYLEGFADVVVQADVMQARAWVRYMLLPQDGRSKWEDDVDALGALLQGLRDHGRLVHDAPVDALAVMLMTHVYGIIFLWTIHPKRTVRQEVQDFCRLHLRALLAPYLPA
ncbi:TetR/AcrR family transcriptional regulator [uncultured Selenomonas sp.]|uniref:TetR/AcrR family transcriptional regulator n=1 Tax=uncultured Selenomonas sp. TaxID=159275 RepID=UPI0028D80757|nr:TetR/AcrR family transcriptional regulator [uncultured Selenomonas sp.]